MDGNERGHWGRERDHGFRSCPNGGIRAALGVGTKKAGLMPAQSILILYYYY